MLCVIIHLAMGEYNSDRPTNRPPAFEKILDKTKNLVHAAAIIIGAASAFSGTIWVFYTQLATDKEVANVMDVHDKSLFSHPLLRERLESLEMKQARLQEDVEMGHAADVALGSKLVSLIAADREPDRHLQALAATFYREEYGRLVRKGMPLEDALLEALRTPWHDRPRR